ncbi:MAG: tRNA lysidine(34) synthetase TilS [Ruthenibacterium sp.]
MDELAAQVYCAIAEHQMIKNGDTVIVACSGGADSVALLHFLFTQKAALGISLRAAHVNHGLRGAQADADAAFVRALCKRLDVPLEEQCLTPPPAANEAWCRDQRYAFFASLCASYGTHAKMATAHTQNDQAETVLLHLARGAGLHGACGIPPVRGNIIRPMLTVTRTQVEAYLAQNGQSYVTDASNQTDAYARNRVRHAAMPALESVNPKAGAALARFAESAAEVTAYLEEQAQQLLHHAAAVNRAGETGYAAAVLTDAPVAVRKAALYRLIAPHADVTQQRLMLADAAVCAGSGAVQLSARAVLSAAQGTVRIVLTKAGTAAEQTALEAWQQPLCTMLPQGTVRTPARAVLHIGSGSYEELVNFTKAGETPLNSVADCGKITCNATFRTRRAGDKFCRAGSNCTKLLKKLYSEAKLSAQARAENPVLADGSCVLWAAGFGFSAQLMPDDDTRQYMTIQINRGEIPQENSGGQK